MAEYLAHFLVEQYAEAVRTDRQAKQALTEAQHAEEVARWARQELWQKIRAQGVAEGAYVVRGNTAIVVVGKGGGDYPPVLPIANRAGDADVR